MDWIAFLLALSQSLPWIVIFVCILLSFLKLQDISEKLDELLRLLNEEGVKVNVKRDDRS